MKGLRSNTVISSAGSQTWTKLPELIALSHQKKVEFLSKYQDYFLKTQIVFQRTLIAAFIRTVIGTYFKWDLLIMPQVWLVISYVYYFQIEIISETLDSNDRILKKSWSRIKNWTLLSEGSIILV